jgi:hypothetical protein
MGNPMTTSQNPDAEGQPVSRRGVAKALVAALAVAGFGTAALNGALARHGADDGGGDDRRRRRRSGGRRRRSGGRNSGGRNSGGRHS